MKNKFLLLSLISLFLFSSCDKVKDIIVELDVPISIKLEDNFIINLTVKNTSSKEQTLKSIDIGNDYLDGIAIYKWTPAYHDSYPIIGFDMTTYVYDLPISPGGEVTIRLDAKPAKRGDFKSTVDFPINSEMTFLTKDIRTIVK